MDTTRSSLGRHFIPYGGYLYWHAFGKLVSLIPRPSQKSNVSSPTLVLVHIFFLPVLHSYYICASRSYVFLVVLSHLL